MIVGLPEAWISPGVIRLKFLEFVVGKVVSGSALIAFGVGEVVFGLHELFELSAGHFKDAHIERPRNPHGVLRFFVIPGLLVRIGGPEQELAAGNDGELHSDRVYVFRRGQASREFENAVDFAALGGDLVVVVRLGDVDPRLAARVVVELDVLDVSVVFFVGFAV
jgi:hypothetical protein